MSVELEGMSDEWEPILNFPDGDGYFEKAETTWNGREIFLQSARGQEGEIFKKQQIEFALVQGLLQKNEIARSLYSRVEYPLPFEDLFLDQEGEIQLAPAWGIDPNQQFMFAPANMQNQVLRCGLKKFWKKHKKAILITAIVIIVVVGAVIAVTVLSASAASTVAGAGGSALAGVINSDSSSTSPSPASANNSPPSSESGATYVPPPPPSFGNFETPKNFTSNSFTPTEPLATLDFHSMLPSSQATLPGVQPFSPPVSFQELKIPIAAQPSSLPSYSPTLPSDFQNNFPPNIPPPPPPPDMTKFWEIKAPVPFAPLSFFEAPSLIPSSSPISEIFSNVMNPEPKTLPADPAVDSSKTLAMQEELKRYPSDLYLVGWLGARLEIEGDRFRIEKTHSFSERLPTLGTPNRGLLILAANGMNTSREEALDHQAYLRGLANNRTAIDFIYNHSNSAPVDILEVFALNYPGYSPIVANLLKKSWQEFADYHKDNPAKKILQICHSQEAIHVYNALKSAPQELRDRVIVVAIAPAKVVPDELCYRSFNYASKSDIVHYGEVLFASALDVPHPDLEPSELWNMTVTNRKELILLEPHKNSKGIDHELQSPTFVAPITTHMNDYINKNGEYP